MEQLSVDSLIKLSDGPESSVDFKRIQSNSGSKLKKANVTNLFEHKKFKSRTETHRKSLIPVKISINNVYQRPTSNEN